MSRTVFVILIAAYLVLRVALASFPGYVKDTDLYKRWALRTAVTGLGEAYDDTAIDYPPLLLYPLYGAGKLYLAVKPEATAGDMRDSTLLNVLVKVPHIAADLLLGALLLWLVSRRGTWGEVRAGPGWGYLAALAYLFNPAVLWGSGYWGQPDGVHSFLALGALALLATERTAWAGASYAAAALTKPLAAPLAPLLAWRSWVRGGWRSLAVFILGGTAAALVIFLPFVLAGRLLPVVRRVVFDVDIMPLTSANAHNLWWLLGSWRPADAVVAGFLTPNRIGLVLFCAVCAAVVVRMHRRQWASGRDALDGEADTFLAAAAIYASFFFLSTHMHENHLFLALPLLLAVAGRSRKLALLAAACTLSIFLNEVTHDLDLPYILPSFLGAESGIMDPYMERPYTWTQLVLSHANALLAGAVAAFAVLFSWKGSR